MHTLMAGVQTADAHAGIRQPTSSWFCSLRVCVYHWPAYICTVDVGVLLTLLLLPLLLICVVDNDISPTAGRPLLTCHLACLLLRFSPPTLRCASLHSITQATSLSLRQPCPFSHNSAIPSSTRRRLSVRLARNGLLLAAISR